MMRQTTATMQNTAIYDNCLIVSCLKNLFKGTAKAQPEHGFIICKHIAEVRKELEQVNNGSIIEMSFPYLDAMERSTPGAAFRYVVIYKKNTPVLFGYFQLYTLTSQNFSFEKNKGFIKGLFRFFLDLKKVRVLISGNALRNETVCCCFNQSVLNNEEAAEIMASVAEKIADEDAAEAIILKDTPDSGDIRRKLAALGYQMPWEDKLMAMTIDPAWQSIDDYIIALSRKYRTRANKILASATGIVARELTEEDIVEHKITINRLFRNVAEKQAFVLTLPGPDHFVETKKVYKSNFEVFGFFQGKKMVAFYSAFVSADVYDLYYAGFDYELNGEYQLYFNILFSGLVRAIALNKKQLKLGRTSFDAKASIGARPVDVPYFIKTANIPSVVFKWFRDYFSSMEDAKWKLRNPFREVVLEKASV